MEAEKTLELKLSTDQLQKIHANQGGEVYLPATDAWFEKLYQTDPKTGLANVDQPLKFESVILSDGQQKLSVTYKGLEVEEFMNQPVDSDERFGFVIVVGGSKQD